MTRHFASIVFAGLTFGMAAVGCGSDPAPPTSASVSQPPSTTDRVDVADDLFAVAALDRSAMFSIRDDALVRVDPDTSEVLSSWALPPGMVAIGAVAPEGRWVALTDRPPAYDPSQPRSTTKLAVLDGATGSETRQLPLAGDVRPEAFSVNGELLFVLDYRGDHYRVQTITLATGDRYDTTNRDKTLEREDMHGTTVRSVMNSERTVLATLYRNPGDKEEPAFVHILDLVHGWAYCADLPPPFGTGRTDRIELTAAGTVIVTASKASRVAEIHINEVLKPNTTPITVEYRYGTLE